MVHHSLIEIFTSEMSVSWGGYDLKNSFINCEDWDIESSSSEIEDNDVHFLFLVETISDCCCGWLIKDPYNIQPCDSPCILCGLSLPIIEISWYSHNNICDLCSKISLCDISHLVENHCRNLLRCVLIFLTILGHLDVWLWVLINDTEGEIFFVMLDFFVIVFPTNQPLYCVDRIGRINCGLILCCLTN